MRYNVFMGRSSDKVKYMKIHFHKREYYWLLVKMLSKLNVINEDKYYAFLFYVPSDLTYDI